MKLNFAVESSGRNFVQILITNQSKTHFINIQKEKFIAINTIIVIIIKSCEQKKLIVQKKINEQTEGEKKEEEEEEEKEYKLIRLNF